MFESKESSASSGSGWERPPSARCSADSVEELGRTPADLGPRYLVTYRFDFSDVLIRQDLYPYAKGGPVTYTPPGHELTAGVNMQITAGWYQSSLGFFQYLVDHGLPETNPVDSAATRERAPDAAPGAQTAPWAGIVVVLVGLAALSLAALAVRRRVLWGAGEPLSVSATSPRGGRREPAWRDRRERLHDFSTCPRQESNLRTRFRKPLLYPLSYEGEGCWKGGQTAAHQGIPAPLSVARRGAQAKRLRTFTHC